MQSQKYLFLSFFEPLARRSHYIAPSSGAHKKTNQLEQAHVLCVLRQQDLALSEFSCLCISYRHSKLLSR